MEKNTTSTGTQVLVVRKGRKSVVCDLVMFNTSVGMISEFFFLPSKLAPLNVVQCRWFKFSSLRCACFRENTSESERDTVSSKLRQLILVLNNITLSKPIICHVCGANCVDVLVLKLFLSSTFFSSSSLKCFFNSLFGNFFLPQNAAQM